MKNKRSLLCLLILTIFSEFLKAQSNDSVYIYLPEYGVNEIHNTLFDSNQTYYGLYEQEYFSNYCELIELTVNDTSYVNAQGSVVNYRKLDKVKDPIFIICKDKLEPVEQLVGRKLNDRMIYPCDEIQFFLDKKYILFANGNPIPDQNRDQNAYSSIENYEIILRKIDKGKITEQTIFISEKVIKADLPNPGVYFKWIGDVNQDGKIDMLFTIIRHHECFEVVLLLSTPENEEVIVKEVYREVICS